MALRRNNQAWEVYNPDTKTVVGSGFAKYADAALLDTATFPVPPKRPPVKGDVGGNANPNLGTLYEPGDHILAKDDTGSPHLCCINAIGDDGIATLEKVDANLTGTGETFDRKLTEEVGIQTEGMPDYVTALAVDYGLLDSVGEDDGGAPDSIDTGGKSIKAGPSADAPDSAFAYVPKDGPPSGRKLPITKDDGKTLDPTRIRMAWQAITKGLMGNKPKGIPSDQMDAVKRRIRSAANALPDGDAKDTVLAYINGKSTGKAKTPNPLKSMPVIADDTPTTAVKMLDEETGRIGGYLNIWGDSQHKDLTPYTNADGSKGEYFTPQTNFELDWFPVRPILFHHGLDGAIKTSTIGTIDTLTPDDVGLWAEGQIKARNAYVRKYADKAKELVKEGKLSWSSGAVSHLVQRARDGRLDRWPLIEGSLTATPMEPRLTEVYPMKSSHVWESDQIAPALKSWGIATDHLYEDLQQDGVTERAENSASDTNVAAQAEGTNENTLIVTKEETEMGTLTMTEEQFQEHLKAAVAAGAAAKTAEPPKPEPEQVVPGKSLQPTPPPPTAPATKTTNDAVVIGDVRYAGLTSAEQSYLVDMMNILQYEPKVAGKELGGEARRFMAEFTNDSDRKMQREISAKAHKEVARNQLPQSALIYLPYKSLDAAESNNWTPVAIKSGELDNTSASNQGVDWVPTIWSDQLWTRVRISNPVASNIDTIMMPSNPFNLPIMSTDPVVYFTGEAADATDLVFQGGKIAVSQIKTGKQALTAKKLTSRAAMSTEFNEDSIIAVLPDVYAQTIRTMQNAIDNSIINGDTVTTASTNINLIDGTPASAPNQPSYLVFNGFRKMGLITATGQSQSAGGAITLKLFRSTRFLLANQYAVDIPNLVAIVDVQTYQRMLNIPEFSTYMNSGVAPSAVTGLLPNGMANQVAQQAYPVGQIDGVNIYVSAEMPLANTSGDVSATPSNNTTGTLVIYHRTRWKLGYRRQVQLETYSSPFLGDTIQIMASARIGLNSFENASVGVLYDIA